MRVQPIIAAVALFILLAPPSRAPAANDPGSFMSDLGNRVLQLVNDKAQPAAERKKEFVTLADRAFAVPKIAQFVLGRYWRTANESEQQQFTKAFETYMINVYWSRFNQYTGEQFKVTNQRPEGNDLAIVTTQILQSSGKPPVKVDWTVTRTPKGFEITDVSIDGVSQALTYRQEFAAVLERHQGQVSALIDELKKKSGA